MSAELASIVPGHQVDDNAHIMLRFSKRAKGMMWVSMVVAEHMQGQRIRVYGEKGSLNIYSDITDAVLASRDGVVADSLAYLFPTVEDGVLGVKFVAAVATHQWDGCWVDATLDLHER